MTKAVNIFFALGQLSLIIKSAFCFLTPFSSKGTDIDIFGPFFSKELSPNTIESLFFHHCSYNNNMLPTNLHAAKDESKGDGSQGLVDIGSNSLFDEENTLKWERDEKEISKKSWIQEVKRALAQHKRQPQSRYVQLATCGGSDFPSCRTVVFRGFADFYDSTKGILKFITDLRSEKIKDIEANPRAEVCWYFNKTREQFRIKGNLVLVKFDEQDPKLARARQVQWKSLSDNARIQFAWPFPGKKRTEDEDDEVDFKPPKLSESEPADTFCLLLLEPLTVDHLQLKTDPQLRSIYSLLEAEEGNEKQTNWNYQRVNP
mmetsp:Transcript_16935/g.22387  ORF Transcript_16935/g.22387 Transcript_16935/m.22387 type:complete len:317 (+) Transcript_16935:91-1041(+)